MSKQCFKEWRDYIYQSPENVKIGINIIRMYGAVPWYIPDAQTIKWMDKYYENKSF